MDYLQPTIGLFALLALGAVFSENIKSIKIRYVVTGVLIQFILAILLTKVELISSFFNILSDGVMVLKAANDYGTGFVFGYLADGAPNAPFDINNPAGTFYFCFWWIDVSDSNVSYISSSLVLESYTYFGKCNLSFIQETIECWRANRAGSYS